MKKLVIVVLWVACSIVDRGYLLGQFTAEFPDQNNSETTIFALAGPFALPAALMAVSTGAPFLWHAKTCQERYDEFVASGSKILGKHYFVHFGGNYGCRESELHD